MESSRIITLSSPITVTASTFEDAFGEYSEVRGRGRQRRKERKLERIAAKKEVRAAKQEARKEKKVGRQEVRQAVKQARVAKRAAAQADRQAKRTAAVAARQERRTARKTARVERRGIGRDAEQTMDNQTSAEMTESAAETPVEETFDEGVSEQTEETATEEGGEEPVEEIGEGEGESETTEESDVDSAEEQAAEEGEYFDGFDGGNTEGINYEDLGSNDEIYALKDDDFYSFDGEELSTADGEYSEARGKKRRARKKIKAKISPKVKKAAMKSEWNKEMVSRLEKQAKKINEILSTGNNPPARQQALSAHLAKLNRAISTHKNRAVGFDGMLSDYVNFDGDTFDSFDGDELSTAEGDYSEAMGRGRKRGIAKKNRNAVRRRRRAEVRAAKKRARKQRAMARKAARKAKKAPKANVTMVEQGLGAQISPNKIVIPASLNYGGGEEIEREANMAFFSGNDYDAPTEYTYSSADGMKNVNWKGILIGAGIAALAIYGAKKAKLF